jgi:hypothetical protein
VLAVGTSSLRVERYHLFRNNPINATNPTNLTAT